MFKNIIINNEANLSYSSGYLVIEQEEISKVYLDDVSSIMLNSLRINIY